MNYLYHRVPTNMKGKILYPLNLLKSIDSELYQKHISKYSGREQVMDQFLPTLNKLWNDVLHFSAVHPRKIKEALIKAGGDKNITLRAYQIDPNILEPEKTTIYFSGASREKRMDLQNFTSYSPAEIEKYSELLEETFEYYVQCYENNKKPLLFHKVPHILYDGALDISNFTIIEV